MYFQFQSEVENLVKNYKDVISELKKRLAEKEKELELLRNENIKLKDGNITSRS